MMSLRTGSHQSVPTPQGLPNNIMHPTRIMGLAFSRWWLRAGDDERLTKPLPGGRKTLMDLMSSNFFVKYIFPSMG